jgi:hypothetical protein
VTPVHRSKNLRLKPTGTLCGEVKASATSTWHAAPRSQLVAVSGVAPPMLHGVEGEQYDTLLTGSAFAGAYVGTARGPPCALGVGLAFGLVLGVVPGLGECCATGPPPLLLLRLARMIPPAVPRSRIRTTAMIAGISQDGRSEVPPPAGLRATVGLRAGALIGARCGGASGGGATGAAVAISTAGAAPPGFQTGGSIGVQVC